MIVYGTQEEIDVLKDFFTNLSNTELTHTTQAEFSDVKTVPLSKELLCEMEKNIDVN